jgi:hypothetical protein
LAVQQITEYIIQNRDTYTREAIDRQLLDAGYAQADITAAWDSLNATLQGPPPDAYSPVPAPPGQLPYGVPSRWGDEYTSPEQRPARVTRSPLFWTVLLAFIVVSYAVPALVAIYPIRDATGLPNFNPVWIIFLLLQIGAIVGGLIALGRNRPVGMALLIGVLMVVVVLPVCAFGILLGVCVVFLTGTRF